MLFNKAVNLALIIYIILVAVIVSTKPKVFFNEKGDMKCTGCGDNKLKSIFSFPVFVVLSSIFIYFIISYFIK